MARLSCDVSKPLLDEIKRFQIDKGFKSRGDTLEFLINTAMDHVGRTVDVGSFGTHNYKECYVELKKQKFEDTTPYRKHYLLTGKKEFLLHAICHGVIVLSEVGTVPPHPNAALPSDTVPPVEMPPADNENGLDKPPPKARKKKK